MQTTLLRLESESSADLVSGWASGGVVETLGVEGETEGGLNAWTEGLSVAEGEDTSVVDLGLDEGGVVEVRLCADLEVDVGWARLCVVDSLSASLDVAGDSVVVGRSEDVQVVETVEGDGVLRGRVADGGSVSADLAVLNRVRSLSTGEQAVLADDAVEGEGRALEDVEEGAAVEAWLLVDGACERRLTAALREKRGLDVELQALCDVVLQLELGLEDVGRGPRLGEDDALGCVDVLALDVAVDVGGLGVAQAGDLEGDVGRGLGLDLELGAVDWEVLREEVVGGLAEVL